MALNLEKQLLFVRIFDAYGSYHHDPVNVGIHITCVPILLMTAFLLLTNTPALPIPEWLSVPNLPLNVGTVGSILYSGLYILMEPVAGAMIAPLLVGGTAYANHLTATYGAKANYIAVGVHIVSWIAQFIGHGVYEGRAPALMDNLVQALFLAPFFVWLEVLFYLGYRPELKTRLDAAIQKEIAGFRASKSSKSKATNGSINSTSARLTTN